VSPRAQKLVPTRVWDVSRQQKRLIGVPHDGSEVPGFAEWMAGQEGSTKHARRMVAGKGRARLKAILATAPELATLYRQGVEVLRWYDRERARDELAAKYTKDYRDLEHEVRRTETFCEGVINAVTLGITEPWAIMTYACERVGEFDRRRRRRKRVPADPLGGQQRNILQLAHQLIANRLADDYQSLRREVGQRLKGDVSDSNITKVLEHHGGEFAAKYGKRFVPKSRRG